MVRICLDRQYWCSLWELPEYKDRCILADRARTDITNDLCAAGYSVREGADPLDYGEVSAFAYPGMLMLDSAPLNRGGRETDGIILPIMMMKTERWIKPR